ncbi:methyltransferase family protein [Bacteroidota bacterium]
MKAEKIKGYHHKSDAHRTDLAGEHRIGDAVQVIFLIVFLAVWGLDSFVFKYTTFLAESVPWFIRIGAGAIILVSAFSLARSGLRIVFGEVRDTPEVIKKGAFSVIRHPIYLGAILLYLGMISFTLSLASVALWVIIIIFYWFISRYEEKLLIQMFGDEYKDYQKKTPMLFPLKLRRS